MKLRVEVVLDYESGAARSIEVDSDQSVEELGRLLKRAMLDCQDQMGKCPCGRGAEVERFEGGKFCLPCLRKRDRKVMEKWEN